MNYFNFDAEIRKLLVGISSIFPREQNFETSPWYCFDLQQCITQLGQGVRARFNNLLRRSCSAVFCLSSYVCVCIRARLSVSLLVLPDVRFNQIDKLQGLITIFTRKTPSYDHFCPPQKKIVIFFSAHRWRCIFYCTLIIFLRKES